MTSAATSPRALRNFINGEYVDANTDASFDVIDPSNEEVYASSPVSSQRDVDLAYGAAAAAFESWGETTPAHRQLALFRIADAIEARAEEFAALGSRFAPVVNPLLQSRAARWITSG